ncbi:MAG: NAD-binding protein [Clostridiales bacterium]|nr:NAD-binding protein [Clostridiales bacterium]
MMWFQVCLTVSVIFFAAGIGLFFVERRSGSAASHALRTPLNTLLAAVFCAATVMFVPIYHQMFPGGIPAMLKTVLLSIHNAIRLFIVDGEFTIVTESIPPEYGCLYTAYTLFAAIVFVVAPVLTFSLVLSLFKNASEVLRLLTKWNSDLYVFSELNQRSLTLARDIAANGTGNAKRTVVFTDVFEQNNEETSELIEGARSIRAILLKQDICTVTYPFHSKRKQLKLFILGSDSSENIVQALSLISRYKNREESHLYVLCTNLESDLLLSSAESGRMNVRRIDPERSLVNRLLYENGDEIFSTARETEDGKQISAVIVGLGRYGSSLLKALSWFCQMDGYHLQITAFDQNPLAEETLRVQCPELLSDKYNGVRIPGEAEYRITIHAGVAVGSQTFVDGIGKLREATWVFVALGDDTKNIETAAYLRMLFARSHSHPKIKAVVDNTEKKNALHGLKNFKGQSYDIDFIGDLESSWRESTVLHSELEQKALAIHRRWGEEEMFWKYEYNYRSSMASAIHSRARIACGIPGAGKAEKEMSPEEHRNLSVLEHKRWNAYMRSEGYVFSGTTEKSSRNDLAKVHYDLVPDDALAESEKKKDDLIVTA